MLRELRRFEAKSTPRQLDLPLLIRSVRAARGRGRPRLHAPGTVRSRRQDRHHASAADPTLSSTLRWTRTSPSTRLQACRRASAPRTTPPASPERRTPNGSFGHLLFLEPEADAARWRSRDAAQRRGPEQASKVDKGSNCLVHHIVGKRPLFHCGRPQFAVTHRLQLRRSARVQACAFPFASVQEPPRPLLRVFL